MGIVGEQKQVPPRAQFSASGALGLVGMTIPHDRNRQTERSVAPPRQSAARNLESESHAVELHPRLAQSRAAPASRRLGYAADTGRTASTTWEGKRPC